MTQQQVANIVEDRITKWCAKLIEGHATPLVLIGLGHDHRQGVAVTCLEQGITTQQAVAYLEKVVQMLKESK